MKGPFHIVSMQPLIARQDVILLKPSSGGVSSTDMVSRGRQVAGACAQERGTGRRRGAEALRLAEGMRIRGEMCNTRRRPGVESVVRSTAGKTAVVVARGRAVCFQASRYESPGASPIVAGSYFVWVRHFWKRLLNAEAPLLLPASLHHRTCDGAFPQQSYLPLPSATALALSKQSPFPQPWHPPT